MNELMYIFSNRRVLVILLALPLIYTLCFGEMFIKNLVTEVPIIVVNLDDGNSGQKFLRDLYDTPEIEIVEVIGDSANIDEKILNLGVVSAVVIPKDYSQKISHGESVTIALINDNTNTILSSTVSRAVQSVVSANNAEVLARSAFLSLSNRIFYNPTSGYTDFFMTIVIPHAVQIATVFSIAPAIVEEKLSRRLTIKILAMKLLIYSAISISVTAICLSIGIKFFGMICRGDFSEIILLVAAFTFCVTAFAICAGAWNNEPYHAISYTLAYIMPSILFTGSIWPRYSMDGLSLFLSYVMPMGYAANDLRNLFLKGSAYGWGSHALILICMCGVFFITALIGLKITGGKADVADNAARTSDAD